MVCAELFSGPRPMRSGQVSNLQLSKAVALQLISVLLCASSCMSFFCPYLTPIRAVTLLLACPVTLLLACHSSALTSLPYVQAHLPQHVFRPVHLLVTKCACLVKKSHISFQGSMICTRIGPTLSISVALCISSKLSVR